MKKLFLLLLTLTLAAAASAQTAVRYAKSDLAADLDYVAVKITQVHNAPFTCFTESDFDAEARRIRDQLCDSMTLQQFGEALAPLFRMLGDEHALLNGSLVTAAGPSRKSDNQAITYQRFGEVGVLTIRHFRINKRFPITLWREEIGKLAKIIRRDGIRNLLIDVSANSGGSSRVGELLLAYFCPRDYRDYSWTWRRSDDYLDFMKRLGGHDAVYESLAPGTYFTKPSRTIEARKELKPFSGKLWIAVGDGTFSSAMIFAAIVKDNNLATVIGETPQRAHPNHFGEMIFLKAPKTGLSFCFGVKHFIRPSGAVDDNTLLPDVPVDLSQIKTLADWLPYLK